MPVRPVNRRRAIGKAVSAFVAINICLLKFLKPALALAEKARKSFSPIQKREGRSTGFLGDDPTLAHALIRDRGSQSISSPRTEKRRVVIIGGGISGLAVAYLLRKHQPLLLEQASQFGGNSKAENWDGLEYSLGAAYMTIPDKNNPIYRKFYQPLGLDKLWRKSSSELVAFQNKVIPGFWQGESDDKSKEQFQFIHRYLKTIGETEFPEIPFVHQSGMHKEKILKLDRESLFGHLNQISKKNLGKDLHPHIERFVEQYCWSSFGGSAREISAACGLNFMASEVGGILALPGGNAKVCEGILTSLNSSLNKSDLRTDSLIISVTSRSTSELVVQPKGQESYKIEADIVVIATPKYVAKHILAGIPSKQRAAMDELSYRSYLVGNALFNQPIRKNDAFGLYLFGSGKPDVDTRAQAEKQGFTDVIIGGWAGGGHPSKSVLSLYAPLPFDGARGALLDPKSYGKYHDAFLKKLVPTANLFGLSMDKLEELRLTRWGHPLVLSKVGHLSKNIPQSASQSINGKIYFCNQDNWGMPAIEVCLASAISTVSEIEKALS